MPRARIVAGLIVVLLAVVWVGLPLERAYSLVHSSGSGAAPPPPPQLHTESVRFHAAYGTQLSGWLVPASSRVPTIILIPGFKADRTTMEPYARFLHAGGYDVLLYDGRGIGQSGGSFSLGLREPRDIAGAISFLEQRPDGPVHRYGLLGVSLGAGVAIVSASHLPSVRATIADSAYVDQSLTVDRLDTLRLGPSSLPLTSLGPWMVDHLLGSSLSAFSPLRAVSHITPRALFLIHSRHDANPTTPLVGARRLYAAAGRPKELWIAPRGGNGGAFAAQPGEYERRVLAFLRRYLPSR